MKDRPPLLDSLTGGVLEREDRKAQLGRESRGTHELRSGLGTEVESEHFFGRIHVVVHVDHPRWTTDRDSRLAPRQVRADAEEWTPPRRIRRDRHATIEALTADVDRQMRDHHVM